MDRQGRESGWLSVNLPYSPSRCAKACNGYNFFSLVTGGSGNCKCMDVCEDAAHAQSTAYKIVSHYYLHTCAASDRSIPHTGWDFYANWDFPVWKPKPHQYCSTDWSTAFAARTDQTLAQCKASCEASTKCTAITVETLGSGEYCVHCADTVYAPSSWGSGVQTVYELAVSHSPIATAATVDDLRLVGGNSSQNGRVEVSVGGVWGTVCDDHFDCKAASVVCRALGFSGGTVLREGSFGSGSGQIWLDDVACEGSEASLAECRSRGSGSSSDTGIVPLLPRAVSALCCTGSSVLCLFCAASSYPHAHLFSAYCALAAIKMRVTLVPLFNETVSSTYL